MSILQKAHGIQSLFWCKQKRPLKYVHSFFTVSILCGLFQDPGYPRHWVPNGESGGAECNLVHGGAWGGVWKIPRSGWEGVACGLRGSRGMGKVMQASLPT